MLGIESQYMNNNYEIILKNWINIEKTEEKIKNLKKIDINKY